MIRLSKRQTIDIVALLLLVGLMFAGWWYVTKHKKDTTKESSANTAQTTTNSSTSVSTKKITTLNTPVFLQKTADTSKLPADTPASFTDYIKAKLATTTCTDKKYGGTTIDMISADFVRGAVVCNGGIVTYWYLSGGAWQQLDAKTAPTCAKIQDAKIPVEFVATCIDDSNAQIKNPVGIYK